MRAVQPCDFSSSPVSSNILVLIQPNTPAPPPPLVQRVLLASSANTRWCVRSQVLTKVNFLVFGSYIESWRPELFTGVSLADGCSDPFLQKAGLSDGRILEVNHTRPFSSNIGLCTAAWLSQRRSSPQYIDGAY